MKLELIFILDFTTGFNILHKDNCMRRGKFKFWDLVRLILKTLRYIERGGENRKDLENIDSVSLRFWNSRYTYYNMHLQIKSIFLVLILFCSKTYTTFNPASYNHRSQ